jgi:hypothetical protein
MNSCIPLSSSRCRLKISVFIPACLGPLLVFPDAGVGYSAAVIPAPWRVRPTSFGWCRDCGHQVEPATASLRAAKRGTSADPAAKLLTESSQMASLAEMAERYGPETPVADCRRRPRRTGAGWGPSRRVRSAANGACACFGASRRAAPDRSGNPWATRAGCDHRLRGFAWRG